MLHTRKGGSDFAGFATMRLPLARRQLLFDAGTFYNRVSSESVAESRAIKLGVTRETEDPKEWGTPSDTLH